MSKEMESAGTLTRICQRKANNTNMGLTTKQATYATKYGNKYMERIERGHFASTIVTALLVR